LTIIQTKKYERNELETILRMRCAEEDVTMSTEGLQKLREIARLKSLRYAMQLITISSLIAARRNKDDEVGAGDVARGMQLFMDTARSQDKVQRDTVGYIVDFTARNADDDKAVPEEEEEEGE
jgi:RuvB-like protein 2